MKAFSQITLKKNFGLLSLSLVCLCFGSIAARADFVSDWNRIAVATAAKKANPFAQARYAAIVQLAVFEAVNSITREYQPYLGTITAPPDASPEAAAVQAAYEVLVASFPASLQDLNSDWTASMMSIPDGPAKTDGIAVGHNAAAAMLALRSADGSSPPKFATPGPPVPGEWQATVACPKDSNGVPVGAGFNWQDVTPFGIANAHDFLLGPPPALTSNRYARAYNEVKTVGSMNSTERPADRSNVALFYAASSPTQVFNQAANQVIEQRGASLTENARALALINMATNDSLVASFFNKYRYNFWRPETAIHAGDADGNPKTESDPGFVPFIQTPCFPSYPSNHGSASNAAAAVLRRLFGEGGHSMVLTNPTLPAITLQYTSFRQITNDISDARVYGGIHFRTDQDAGALLGRAIGITVYRHNLRPLRDDHRWDGD